MLLFDEQYIVRDGETKFGSDFFNPVFASLDARIHRLEIVQHDWEAELERIKDIGVETVTELLVDAAAIADGMASLGTILTVGSLSAIEIGSGSKTFIINEADRGKVPTAAYIVAVPVGIAGTSMGGFMTAWDAQTGELQFSPTNVEGSGAYAEWVIGLSAPDTAAGSATADDIAFTPEGTIEAETVQAAIEEIDADVTAVSDRVTALEGAGGGDVLSMAYAAYASTPTSGA